MKEYLIDTNVLVRLVTNDPPSQAKKAKRIINEIERNQAKGFLSLLVVGEFLWVLKRHYGVMYETTVPLLLKLLSLKNIKIVEVEKSDLEKVLTTCKDNSLGYADNYVSHLYKEKDWELITFDKKLKKLSED